MAEFASKGVSGTALGLGIAGTVGLVNSMSQNGFLGGLFGNGGNQLEELRAENTLLKANQYSDMSNKPLEDQICQLKAESMVQAEQIEAMKREAELRSQITDDKIARVADTAACGISGLQNSLICLQQTVAGITKTYVPSSAIAPVQNQTEVSQG